MKPAQRLLITLSAMIAFAGNSLLCRFALKQTETHPASFTVVRIASGALILWLLANIRRAGQATTISRGGKSRGNWPSATALFVYAAAFSFAYVSLPAGSGALLLFGSVQATMIFCGLRRGERLNLRQIVGLALALGGLVTLVLPGISTPPLRGSILMLSAGVAWGIYSLRGRVADNPVAATAGNFLRALPLAGLLSLIFLTQARIDRTGVTLAILSGALASGVGYVLWYAALPSLQATSAATVQLSVPLLAAAGGILLLGEPLTLRFCFAALGVLGGIALVIRPARHPNHISR